MFNFWVVFVHEHRLHLGRVYYDEKIIDAAEYTSSTPISKLYCEACIHEIGNFMGVSFSDSLIDIREKEFPNRTEREKNVSIQIENQEKHEEAELTSRILQAKLKVMKEHRAFIESHFDTDDEKKKEENKN